MATKTYVPGPSLIYVGTGAEGAYQFLGRCANNIRVSSVPKHRGVQVDAAGPDMDADVQFMGEDFYVSFALAKYNESVLQLCKKRLGTTFATTPGAVLAGGIGSLMGLQGNTFPLAIVSTYASQAVFSDMVPGFVIPKAYLADSNTVELSATVKNEQVLFRSLATFGGDGSYVLYNQDIAGLTLPDPD